MSDIEAEQAARALESLGEARAQLARRAKAPWWYHPALGVLAGGLVAAQALPRPAVVLPLYGAGLLLLMQAYRRHTGLWVNGLRWGRTLWVMLPLLAATAVVAFVSLRYGHERGQRDVFLYCGAALALLVTAAGPLWERAFRADLARTA